MPPRVFLETTIPSYLTAGPTADPVRAARQQATADWWARHRGGYELVTSQLVLDECAVGDAAAAAARLGLVAGVTLLPLTSEVIELVVALVDRGPLPPKATDDAYHIATAAVYGIDYVLTWDFKHIANPTLARQVAAVCLARGYNAAAVRTPQELIPPGAAHE